MNGNGAPPAADPVGDQSATKPRGQNKEKRPGNGGGVKVEGVSFSKSKDEDKPGNWFELLLVTAYAIQTCGGATVREIAEYIIAALNSKVRDGTVSDAVEALRKQNIVAVGQNSDGSKSYSMKSWRFNCGNLEVAQVTEMVKTLRADSTGEMILEKFRKEQPTKAPWPAEPHYFEATIQLLCHWLGGHVWAGSRYQQLGYFGCAGWHTLHFNYDERLKGKCCKGKGPFKLRPRYADHKSAPLMFERRAGKIVAAHKANIRGFLEHGISYLGTPSKNVTHGRSVDHFATQAILIEPEERELCDRLIPIVRGNTRGNEQQGAGLANHEVLIEGTELVWSFAMPTKNFMTPGEVKEWLSYILTMPHRSMSPARGAQYGEAVLMKLRHRPVFGGGDWVDV